MPLEPEPADGSRLGLDGLDFSAVMLSILKSVAFIDPNQQHLSRKL